MGGLFLVAMQVLRVQLMDTSVWLALASWLTPDAAREAPDWTNDETRRLRVEASDPARSCIYGAGRPSDLAAYGCEMGRVPNGVGVRRTHRTLRVHAEHTDAIGTDTLATAFQEETRCKVEAPSPQLDRRVVIRL